MSIIYFKCPGVYEADGYLESAKLDEPVIINKVKGDLEVLCLNFNNGICDICSEYLEEIADPDTEEVRRTICRWKFANEILHGPKGKSFSKAEKQALNNIRGREEIKPEDL